MASLFHLSITRPLPTVVTLGGMIDVTYLLDMPHGFTWKGVYVDADLRRVEAVVSTQQSATSGQLTAESSERVKLFMQLSSLQGSILENRIFEDDFKVESISTAKLFQLATRNAQPATAIITIDKTNIDAILTTLSYDDSIKEDITNSVNQNYTIKIPESELTYHDWTGTGYMKENVETGESGWMLSGMIAGGCPVDAVWLEQHFQNTLSHPYAGIVNNDPLSAAWLRKIAATDEQPVAAVNSVLPKPLAVFVADLKGTPVPGASVTFKIIAGDGMLQCLNAAGGNEGPLSETNCTTTSGANGIAQAKLTLGKSTDANPQYMMLAPEDEFSTQIGVNLVTATASSYSGELPMDQPFSQYGKPEVPAKIKKFNGDGAAWYVNNPVGNLRVKVLDQYDNAVSNVTVTFSAQTAESLDSSIPLPTLNQGFRNIEFYKSEECNLPYPEGHIAYPLYGDCASYYGGQTGVGVKTAYFGATINAVLGNTVNTRYKVKVTAQGIQAPEEFTLTSYGYREIADGYMAPSLHITYFELYNDQGELVNAAKVGTELKAPLTAALALYYGEITTEGPYQCTINNQQTNCWKVKSNGIIKTKKITDGTVTFTPKEGNGLVTATTITNGQYQTRYTTGFTPAKNTIEAFGEATVSVPLIFYDAAKEWSASRTPVPVNKPVTVKSGQFIAFEKNSGQAHTGICGVDPATNQVQCAYDTGQYDKVSYTAFGVNAALTIDPEIVLLNDEGYSTVDTTFKYTILPPEYNAIIADVDIYKTGANLDEWINYIPGDKTQGQGTAGFVQGTKFDINTLYKAQMVLNRGTDIEITSTSEINTDNVGNNNGVCEENEACEDKVTIPIAQIRVLTDENQPKEPEEVKFSDGSNNSNGTKKYHIAIKSQSWLSSCETLTGRIVTLSTATATMGQPVSTPQINVGYASEHPIHFITSGNECYPKITDTVDGYSDKDKFIISNRSRTDLDIGFPSHVYNTAVLYAGLGNSFMIEVGGARKMLPIEPAGVVVLGIDGLRQDVLYAPSGTDDGTGVHASYSDTVGSGFSSPYYVPLSDVKGFCAVMGGKYDDGIIYSSCDPAGAEDKHIKIKDVTTIFPSITFAAWASILTGMTPSATGITGNEFFARDMLANYETIPGMYMLPSGMVTLDADGGAFRPLVPGGSYSWLNKSLPFILNYIMPADFGIFSHPTLQTKLDASAPGHALRSEVKPLWADINTLVAKRYKRTSEARCDSTENECRTVSMFNQYAEGADGWGTSGPISKPLFDAFWQLPGAAGISYSAALMDSSSANETAAFISSYFSNNVQNGKRKNFPALFSVYLSGLDHYAHIEGMGEYASYVKSTADDKVSQIVKALKGQDEFDNKIFIIVSDHGETAMPWDYNVETTNPETGQVKSVTPETSCELKLEKFDTFKVQAPEQANNSLHIWELGEMFKQTGFYKGADGLDFAVMAPQEIASLYNQFSYGAKPNTSTANIIAALNGPMAHIYLKNRFNNSWTVPRMVEDIGYVAELLRLTVSTNKTASNLSNLFPVGLFEEDVPILAGIDRLMNSVDMILIRRNDSYEVFSGIKADGSDILSTPLDNYGEFGSSQYVKALRRIVDMNHPDRSGDIVLVMKNLTIGDPIDRFTTAYACKAWHGSLNPSDSYVPLILSYPGGNKSEMDKFLLNVSACPGGQCEGNWNTIDIIKEIMSKQYENQ